MIDSHAQFHGVALWINYKIWADKTVPRNTVTDQYRVFLDFFDPSSCTPCYEIIVSDIYASGPMNVEVNEIHVLTGMLTGSTSTVTADVFNSSIVRPGWYMGELEGISNPEPSTLSSLLYCLLLLCCLVRKRTA